MIDDVINSITQMFSPPLRAILWRSILLALALIVVGGIGLERVIVWLLGAGGEHVETSLGPHAHAPVTALAWILTFAAGLGIVVGSVMLMPAVTALVGSFFADRIGEQVEREYFPADPPGTALPLTLALWEGFKTALMALGIYLVAVPFLLFAGFGVVIFFLATAYILGREYFELAALSPAGRGEAVAQAQCGAGLCRRPLHHRLRLDPGREPRHADLRHGADGAYAQARQREGTRSQRRMIQPYLNKTPRKNTDQNRCLYAVPAGREPICSKTNQFETDERLSHGPSHNETNGAL
jgi:CysZ protein